MLQESRLDSGTGTRLAQSAFASGFQSDLNEKQASDHAPLPLHQSAFIILGLGLACWAPLFALYWLVVR